MGFIGTKRVNIYLELFGFQVEIADAWFGFYLHRPRYWHWNFHHQDFVQDETLRLRSWWQSTPIATFDIGFMNEVCERNGKAP